MSDRYVIHNGIPKTIAEAYIPVDNIEWTYGFGVYENLKVRNGKLYFLDSHLDRLFESARLIGLEHNFNKGEVKKWIEELKEKNGAENANIKILLIGGKESNLYIITLAPKFLDKKAYTQGVHTITREYERFLPQAKTLNMLPSYLFFKAAQKANAHDCLLIDNPGRIREGTRSNFFAIKDKKLFTAPLELVLNGVTRQQVITCARKNGYRLTEEAVLLQNISNYDGAFLTHTSGNIVPIRSIDDFSFAEVCATVRELIKHYEAYLQET